MVSSDYFIRTSGALFHQGPEAVLQYGPWGTITLGLRGTFHSGPRALFIADQGALLKWDLKAIFHYRSEHYFSAGYGTLFKLCPGARFQWGS